MVLAMTCSSMISAHCMRARASLLGDGTIFGETMRIYDHNHRFADPTTPIKDQGYSEAVSIGNIFDWLQCDDS